MNNSWLQYSTTSNRLTSSYVQSFLSVSGNIILRNQGMNILNGDISLNKNFYLTTNNFMQLQTDEISSYIQSGTSYSTGSTSDIVFTGIGKIPEYMRIKGTNGYIGIKTTIPSYYLDVNGSSYFSIPPIMIGNNIYSGIYNDGSNNTGVGIGSFNSYSTFGINNSSFGCYSLYLLSNNSNYNLGNNTIFGLNSAKSNTLGYNNNIFGTNSAVLNATTIQDCIYGANTGVYSNNYISGNYSNYINVNNNIIFGGVSFNSTNNTSYNNICFGYNSYNNFSSNLQNNIFVGSFVGNACISSNNIVIGSNDALKLNNVINTNTYNPINYSDPLLWYDTQDITTLRNNTGNQTTIGGYVKMIKNKALNYIGNYDLISMDINGTTAIYSSKIIQGNSYLFVDLSNATNNISGFYTLGSPIMANGFSCFCVCMIIGNSGIPLFFNKTGVDPYTNLPNPFDSNGTNRIIGNSYDFFGIQNANPNNPFDFGSSTILPNINYIEIDKTSMTYNEYLNGTLSVSYNFNSITPTNYNSGINILPVDNNTTPLYLFGRADGYSNSVYLFEYIYFDGAISTPKRLLIEGYLAWKYNIQQYLPNTHPYYSNKPTALSATTVVGYNSNSNLNNNNISIGMQSLSNNLSGQNNIAVGYQSLYNNNIGSFNHGYGSQSLMNNVSGNYNNGFEYQTLMNNVSGNYNNAFGFQSLYKNTIGNYNCAIGFQSLYNNIEGNYNCAFGTNTMKNSSNAFNYTSSYNSVFGDSGFQSCSTGSNVCVFGSFSLLNNGTGYNNIAIGINNFLAAGGSNNIVFGATSLLNSSITVNNNIIFGTNSCRGIIGDNNIMIGQNINTNSSSVGNTSTLLGSNVCGIGLNFSNCCGAGYQSMYNSNAINQCIYGFKSGFTLTTSPNNVAMGQNSLYSMNTDPLSTGSNIAIGSNALYNCTSGNYNISIGTNSGLNTSIKGNNIFIGNNTGLSSTDAWENSVAIGHGAIITQNNQIVLGTTTTTVYVLGYMRVMENTFIRNSLISSDYRIKQNIFELDETYTTIILNPSSYFNTMTNSNEFGFIADEICEKYPVLTNEMGEEKLKYVNYNGITCISINDLKKLKKMIEKQKIEIINQKKEMENLLFDINKKRNGKFII